MPRSCLALISLAILVVIITITGCENLIHNSGTNTVNQVLIIRYDGPGEDDDGGQALASDNSGNIFISGYSWGNYTSCDYITFKYDYSGNQLWAARYDGPVNGQDWALDMALDRESNVFVTGWSEGNGTGADYATIKYDIEGSKRWVARYDGPGSSYDLARALAVDKTGNVYVTGWSTGNRTKADYATIAYDSEGNELWVARYDGLIGNDDNAYDIDADYSGAVYVTGRSYGTDTGADYATIKYDSRGNRLWIARYDGPVSGQDSAQAILVGDWGNINVTGWSEGNGTGSDYITIRYDSDGNEQWEARYNGPVSGEDKAYAICRDSWSNIYVTGSSEGDGTGLDFITVKYDPSGHELWAERYDGPANGDDRARSVILDGRGNVYVTGWSQGKGTGYDYATVKYSADGNQLWVTRYSGSSNADDKTYAVTVDSLGNPWVTGRSIGNNTSYDYTTVRYVQQ